ncbi:MAG: helix-hairpin-helix domain-containing protein [Miltoncostaeaceae bacterium]
MDALLPWLRRTGWVYLALALAVAAVAWRMAGGGGAAGVQPQGGGGVTVVDGAAPVAGGGAAVGGDGAGDAATAPRVVVHVVGAVRRPGVYTLREGARVQGAVTRAGGAVPRADLAALNLAARVADGQRIDVPRRGEAVAAPAPGTAVGASGAPVSLSAASLEELDGLDGIGPTLAGRIVAWRDANGSFSSVDQLLEVEGIGPGRLESLRPQVVP